MLQDWIDSGNIFIYVAVAALLLALWYFMFGGKRRQMQEMYRDSNAEEARVILLPGEGGHIVPLSVNGRMPVIFSRNGEDGIYINYGINTLEICFEYDIRAGETEPRSVKKVKMEVEARPGRQYTIRFEEESEAFIFEEQY